MADMKNLKKGERRFVSILFADMENYSALSELLDPEELDMRISGVFTAFESIVKQYEGAVEKYIGDALVAVFGVPVIHDDDAVRAVNSALDFLETVREKNSGFSDRGLELNFRIGVHAGLIATGKRGEFEVVTGHAMNVASRLQTEASSNTVLVSEAVRDKCINEFSFSDPLTIQVKGIQEPVRAFRVRGRNTKLLDDDSLFVNRKTETELLIKQYIRHNGENNGGVLLHGSAGIGKTRLIAHFIEKIKEFPHYELPVLYAGAQKYRNINFAVVTDILLDYFGVSIQNSPEKISAELRNKGVEDKIADDFARLINGSVDKKENQSFVLLYIMFNIIIKQHEGSPYPLFAFVDNMQNIDSQSLDFFRFFLKNAPVKPFFVLAGRRADDQLKQVFTGLEEMELAPLKEEDARELIRRGWKEPLNEEVMKSIIGNSYGNPLFLKEYLRYLRENRDITSLPTTIQNIFLTSLESYDPNYKELLRKLSVFAAFFTKEDAFYIQNHTDSPADIVEDALMFFENEGLIFSQGNTFSFTHDVFKKTLYNSILNYNKRIIHGLVALRMEEIQSKNTVRMLHHLCMAEDFTKAYSVLSASPDRFINMEYLAYIDSIIQYYEGKDDEIWLTLLFKKSAILFNNGFSEDVDSILKAMFRIAVSQQKPKYAATAYHLLTAYNLKSYSFQKAIFCGKKGLYFYRLIQERGTENTVKHRINILTQLVVAEALRGNFDECGSLHRRMEELKPDEKKEIDFSKAETFFLAGNYKEALKNLDPFIKEIPKMSRDLNLSAVFILSLIYWHVCDFDSLKPVLQSFFKAATDFYSNSSHLSQVHARYAVCCNFQKDNEEAEYYLNQAEFFLYQIKNDYDYIDAVRTLSFSYLCLENYEKAEKFAMEGIGIGLRHSAYFPAFSLLMIIVEIAIERNETSKILFFLDEADMLLQEGMHVHRRDKLMYYYYRSVHGVPENNEDYLQSARELLTQEVNQIEDTGDISCFLSFGPYRKLKNIMNIPADAGIMK